jgi:hypothetical protein
MHPMFAHLGSTYHPYNVAACTKTNGDHPLIQIGQPWCYYHLAKDGNHTTRPMQARCQPHLQCNSHKTQRQASRSLQTNHEKLGQRVSGSLPRSSRDPFFNFYSQNVHYMRRSSSNHKGEDSFYKIVQIVNTMHHQNIDMHLIQ